jgi:hypothetical protein
MWKYRRQAHCGVAVVALVVFLLLPAPVETQSTSLVDSITAPLGFDGGTTGAMTTTGANLLVACVSSHANAQDPLEIRDSKYNSWTLAAWSYGAMDGHIRLFYSVPTPVSVGADHTFTIEGRGTMASIDVMAWAGATASPLDQTAGKFKAGTSIEPGPVFPTEDNELLISCLTNYNDPSHSSRSINGGFIIDGQVGDSTNPYSTSLAGAYLVQTTKTEANPTWSYSVNTWANAAIATFKTAEDGGGDDLASKPLFYAGDLEYVGLFRAPNDPSSEYAGRGLAYHDGALYMTYREVGLSQQVVKIDIPTALNVPLASAERAAILQGPVDPTDGNFAEVTLPNSPDEQGVRLWSLLVYGGRLIGNAYITYDAPGNQRVGHFARALDLTDNTQFAGWDAVGEPTKVRHTTGPMVLVPEYARAALGGPVLTTGANLASNIGSLSYGFAASAFDPNTIAGRTPTTLPSSVLMDFPFSNPMQLNIAQTCEPYADNELPECADDPSEHWNRATQIGGAWIPFGYRSLLFFTVHGYNSPYCYGSGSSCYDPVSIPSGEHAYPYRYQITAFDLAHFAAVKAGAPAHQVRPYASWPVTFTSMPADINADAAAGVAYDPATKRIWIAQWRREGDYPVFNQFRHP